MFFALAIVVQSRQHRSVIHHHHDNSGMEPEIVSNASGSQIANLAMKKIGCPYVYGAAGPNAFDCSGFVKWVHNQFGIRPPRVASAQARWGKRGSGSVGDVVAFGSPAYHVGICLGGGKFVHAPKPGDKIKITQLRYMDRRQTFRRFY